MERKDAECERKTEYLTEALKILRGEIEAEFQEHLERIKKEIEKMSHCQATNMYGISLSKDDWQSFWKREGIEVGGKEVNKQATSDSS